DVSVDDVLAEALGVALGRRAETARARCAHTDLGTGRRPERALAGELPLGAVRCDHHDATGAAGTPAREPERRGLRPLEAHAGFRRVPQYSPDALDATAAAISAGAARVGHDLVAVDAHGEAHLENLDRRVHRVRDSRRHAGDTVLRRPRP